MLQFAQRFAQVRTRRWFRSSEAALILLSIWVGICAGLATLALSWTAHTLQHIFYGVGINRLSALASIRHPAKLLFLPLGGLVLGLVYRFAKMRQAPVDVVEANALHGGRIPLKDSFWISIQTIISNGFGASVGLEAAYAQAGGGLASMFGQWFRLKRGDLRTLVGAGAGAAIGAAFGAPLTGAFYAFEVVIGAYTPASIAPVAAAALAAALVTRTLGATPYLVASSAAGDITTTTYILFAGLGVISALIGIAVMQLQAVTDRMVSRTRLPTYWRPVIGGLILIPIVWTAPQALSSGHGALRLDLALHPALTFLLLVFILKILASVVSLSFGFRGGLFFAALFLGSLLGPIYAQCVNAIFGSPVLNDIDAALVGMAALAVTVVGGPMTLSLLVLETTQDFPLTGVVITASLCASSFTRSYFGYSFSTWRLHLRGSQVRSARDIGWGTTLTAERMMRRDPTTASASLSVEAFRAAVPLGSTSRVLLTGANHEYRGIVATEQAYDPDLDIDEPVATLARLQDEAIDAKADIKTILDKFENLETDDLAVVDQQGRILGVLTEKFVNRRYIEESEKAQSQLFGE